MSRFDKIAAKLSQYDLDAMMITSALNRLYATGFPSSAGLLTELRSVKDEEEVPRKSNFKQKPVKCAIMQE